MKQAIVLAAALTLLDAAVSANAPSTTNAVFVGGTPIMRVRVGAAGYTPAQRASAIQERLNGILAHGPIRPTDITAEPQGSEAVVRVQGRLLFTADGATARFNQATPIELANQWADHLRMVLPGLTQAK
ncbi:MAG: hypothetical protein M3Y13_04115 [Armatimonadota bacterium]|nr:hypothetical protein [Armatimonadota bacterium]